MSPAISKKDSSVSMADKLKDFYRNYLESNEAPKTKSEFNDIKRMTWDNSEINLPENSRSQTKSALMSVLKEKGFDAPEGLGIIKKSGVSGTIEATFEGAGKKIEQMMGNPNQPNQQQQPNQEGFGIFKQNPNIQNQQIPQSISQPQILIQPKVLSDSEKESNKRFLKQSMQIPKRLWVEFGIVDSEDLGEKEKPQTWSEQYDEWVESLADICNEHGYSFPAKMELILAGVTGVSLLVLPLIMKVMGMKGDKKKESKKKEEPNK